MRRVSPVARRGAFAEFFLPPGRPAPTPSAGCSALNPEPFARGVDARVSEAVGALADEVIAVDGTPQEPAALLKLPGPLDVRGAVVSRDDGPYVSSLRPRVRRIMKARVPACARPAPPFIGPATGGRRSSGSMSLTR